MPNSKERVVKIKRKIYKEHLINRNAMTIIIGIICKDGIVMASDSQAMSNRGVDVKRMDYTKLYELNGELGIKGIIGGAGAVPFINKAIQLLKCKCKDRNIKEIPPLIECAEDIITELTRRYVIEKVQLLGIGSSGKKTPDTEEMPQLPLILMLSCVYKEKPFLFIITSEGVGEEEQHFSSIGSGSAYAEYVLGKLYFEGITTKEAIEMAVNVIEEVKKIDPNVGGDVQVSYINKEGNIKEVEEKMIMEIMQKIRSRDELISSIQRKLISGKINEEDLKKLI